MSRAAPSERRSGSRARQVVVVVVVLLAFYFVLLGSRAVTLLTDHRWVVRGLGLGVLLLPVLGIVIVVQELRFGRSAERLGNELEADDGAAAPADRHDRPSRDVADAAFARRKAEVQETPDDWRAWYRLGVAYGDAGDVARGRRAVRRAIALEARSRRK